MKKAFYVLGFIFSANRQQVILITKRGRASQEGEDQNKRPQWMDGKLNGIGGVVEEGLDHVDVMVQKARDEVNISTSRERWRPVGIMDDDGNTIVVFSYVANTQEFYNLKSMTDEQAAAYDLNRGVNDLDIIPNLAWMIPFAAIEQKALFSVSYNSEDVDQLNAEIKEFQTATLNQTGTGSPAKENSTLNTGGQKSQEGVPNPTGSTGGIEGHHTEPKPTTLEESIGKADESAAKEIGVKSVKETSQDVRPNDAGKEIKRETKTNPERK